MISRLRGAPAGRSADGLVVDVGGVGYLVSATPAVLRRADGASEITVETYLHVREDALQLVRAVFAAARNAIPFAERDDIESQLPVGGLKELWRSPEPANLPDLSTLH